MRVIGVKAHTKMQATSDRYHTFIDDTTRGPLQPPEVARTDRCGQFKLTESTSGGLPATARSSAERVMQSYQDYRHSVLIAKRCNRCRSRRVIHLSVSIARTGVARGDGGEGSDRLVNLVPMHVPTILERLQPPRRTTKGVISAME